MSDPNVVQLTKPIVRTFRPAGGGTEREETIETLTFREPTFGDLEATDGFDPKERVAMVRALAARLCDQPVDVINRLALADAVRVGKWFFENVSGSLKTLGISLQL